jgi:CHAT domain-containing protein
VVVPDGAVWQVPFQALVAPSGRYLIEDVSLRYAPSLATLAEMARAPVRSPSRSGNVLLAFGNPTIGADTAMRVRATSLDESLGPLPDAGAQVQRLARLYGKDGRVLIGSEATEDRAKTEAGRYQVLHLATHGVLDDRDPLYSHVLLARGPGSHEDGLLEAREVLDMSLSADLVVLSACETARGRVGAGEGVIGLSWAFFVAGVPRLVVSQWKVEASSTTELMVAFHTALRGDAATAPLPAAEALRRAELLLLRTPRYRHPFYWAGFVALGAP